LHNVFSVLSANEAMAEAAKSAILTRFSGPPQALSLIFQGMSSQATWPSLWKAALPQALAERPKNLLFFNWLIEPAVGACCVPQARDSYSRTY
jgi:hypothetical protein